MRTNFIRKTAMAAGAIVLIGLSASAVPAQSAVQPPIALSMPQDDWMEREWTRAEWANLTSRYMSTSTIKIRLLAARLGERSDQPVPDTDCPPAPTSDCVNSWRTLPNPFE